MEAPRKRRTPDCAGAGAVAGAAGAAGASCGSPAAKRARREAEGDASRVLCIPASIAMLVRPEHAVLDVETGEMTVELPEDFKKLAKGAWESFVEHMVKVANTFTREELMFIERMEEYVPMIECVTSVLGRANVEFHYQHNDLVDLLRPLARGLVNAELTSRQRRLWKMYNETTKNLLNNMCLNFDTSGEVYFAANLLNVELLPTVEFFFRCVDLPTRWRAKLLLESQARIPCLEAVDFRDVDAPVPEAGQRLIDALRVSRNDLALRNMDSWLGLLLSKRGWLLENPGCPTVHLDVMCVLSTGSPLFFGGSAEEFLMQDGVMDEVLKMMNRDDVSTLTIFNPSNIPWRLVPDDKLVDVIKWTGRLDFNEVVPNLLEKGHDLPDLDNPRAYFCGAAWSLVQDTAEDSKRHKVLRKFLSSFASPLALEAVDAVRSDITFDAWWKWVSSRDLPIDCPALLSLTLFPLQLEALIKFLTSSWEEVPMESMTFLKGAFGASMTQQEIRDAVNEMLAVFSDRAARRSVKQSMYKALARSVFSVRRSSWKESVKMSLSRKICEAASKGLNYEVATGDAIRALAGLL